MFIRVSRCIREINYWGPENRPLWRGLLHCVPISEGPLSEVLLYTFDKGDSNAV